MNPDPQPRVHRLLIAYDGRNLHGWQTQKHHPTVQQNIETVLQQLWGRRIDLHGSGRTDTGVHALGQVATFTAPPRFPDPARLIAALNNHLPPDIRVLKARLAPDEFHARFSATGKEYLYRVVNQPIMPPHKAGLAWHVPRPLDLDAIDRAAAHLTGTHDFSSFASNPGYKRTTMVRTMTLAVRKGSSANLRFHFRADGFLYRMVRNIMGALIQTGLGKITPDRFREILLAHDRTAAANTAPAHGLYLLRVFYP